MIAGSHICTACGYEGKPTRPPSDHAGEDESFLVGVFNKLFFMVTFIPLKFGWIVRLAQRGKAKHCPNCGLPLMVKLGSDAGWLAKRKNDIKAGLYTPNMNEELAPGFGRELHLPEVEKPLAIPVPRLEKLPELGALLVEPEIASETAQDTIKPQAEVKPKKPVDPDAW